MASSNPGQGGNSGTGGTGEHGDSEGKKPQVHLPETFAQSKTEAEPYESSVEEPDRQRQQPPRRQSGLLDQPPRRRSIPYTTQSGRTVQQPLPFDLQSGQANGRQQRKSSPLVDTIDPSQATNEERERYVSQRWNEYNESSDIQLRQWRAFKEDFHDWEPRHFALANKAEGHLRDMLMYKGVWVPQKPHRIADRLSKLLLGYAKWPTEAPLPTRMHPAFESTTNLRELGIEPGYPSMLSRQLGDENPRRRQRDVQDLQAFDTPGAFDRHTRSSKDPSGGDSSSGVRNPSNEVQRFTDLPNQRRSRANSRALSSRAPSRRSERPAERPPKAQNMPEQGNERRDGFGDRQRDWFDERQDRFEVRDQVNNDYVSSYPDRPNFAYEANARHDQRSRPGQPPNHPAQAPYIQSGSDAYGHPSQNTFESRQDAFAIPYRPRPVNHGQGQYEQQPYTPAPMIHGQGRYEQMVYPERSDRQNLQPPIQPPYQPPSQPPVQPPFQPPSQRQQQPVPPAPPFQAPPPVQTTNQVPWTAGQPMPGLQQALQPLNFTSQPLFQPGQSHMGKLLAGYQQSQGYSREFASLAKFYTDDTSKYSGSSDCWLRKSTIFVTNALSVGFPIIDALTKATSIMLKGSALNFYHSHIASFHRMDMEQLSACFKGHFEGREHQIAISNEWDSFTFRSWSQAHPTKTMQQCIDSMMERLEDLQFSFPENYHTEETLARKLIQACDGVEPLEIACQKPADTLIGIKSDLQRQAAVWDRHNPNGSASAMFAGSNAVVLYTDRNYKRADKGDRPSFNRQGNRRDDRFRTGGGNKDLFRGRGVNKPYKWQDKRFTNKGIDGKGQRCFVCGKPGCWSWRHPTWERHDATKQFFMAFEGECEECCEESDELETVFTEGPETYLAGGEDMGSEQTDSFNIVADDPQPQQQAGGFFTSIGSIDPSTCQQLVQQFAVHATIHAISGTIPLTPEWPKDGPVVLMSQMRYNDVDFRGALLDTGASMASSIGWAQYQALIKQQPLPLQTDTPRVTFTFGIGAVRSRGTVDIPTPIGVIHTHVVDADTPFLLCVDDLDRAKCIFDNLDNVVRRKGSTFKVPVVRQFGHPFMVWDVSLAAYLASGFAFINDGLSLSDLKRLHRQYGHPAAHRLNRQLERSKHDFDAKLIEKITQHCEQCQKHGGPPARWKFTIRDDELQFNHTVIVDIMYLNHPAEPVLHLVDEATRYQAARFLKNVSAAHVWESIRAAWIDTYVGPPDIIKTDSGTQFTAGEFVSLAKSMAISVHQVPTEAHHSIGAVERYHRPLRRAYDIVREHLPHQAKEFSLQMAVKAVNDSAGPDGITPTLLVFGTYPRMVDADPPYPSIAQRAKTVKRAMAEVAKLFANRDIQEALRHRNAPRTNEVLDVPIGGEVLVYREKGDQGVRGGWTGPFKLLSISGHQCHVQLPQGPKDFRITSVKAYRRPLPNEGAEEMGVDKTLVLQKSDELDKEETTDKVIEISSDEESAPDSDNTPRRPKRANRGKLPTHLKDSLVYVISEDTAVYLTDKERASLEQSSRLRAEGHIRTRRGPFIESRESEITGLIDKGVFKLVPHDSIPPGTRIFGCRFVDDVKYKDGLPYEKSRLVVQAHSDQGKMTVLTQAPTIQRPSQRLIVCLSRILGRRLYLRDISMAYTQSTSELNRDFYVRAPADLNLGGGLMKVVKPLYGVPEAGTHWFKTYHKHHTTKLGLTVSPFDACLMYSKDAIVGLQVDDSLGGGTEEFMVQEDTKLQEAGLQAKPAQLIDKDIPLAFNGTTIELISAAYQVFQRRQCNKIETIPLSSNEIDNQTRLAYTSGRALGAYIASMTQPEASFALSRAAQTLSPERADVEALNTCLDWQLKNAERPLQFIELSPEGLKIFVFVDAAFANNKDLSSQLGYVIILANEAKQTSDDDTKAAIRVTGNIIHWSSTKSKRVVRSVLAAELYAMVAGFDIAAALKETINKVMDRHVPLVVCTDSFSLYECVTKLGTTAEKRLMIDILALRQSYELHEINEIRWIDGASNPADAMTKEKDKACGALAQLVNHNGLVISSKGWIERTRAPSPAPLTTSPRATRGPLVVAISDAPPAPHGAPVPHSTP